jgi:hypothetical protein
MDRIYRMIQDLVKKSIYSAFAVLTPSSRLRPGSPAPASPGEAGDYRGFGTLPERSEGRDWGEEVRTEKERKAE